MEKEKRHVMLSMTLKNFVNMHKDDDVVLDKVGGSLDKAIGYINKMPRGHSRMARLYSDIDKAMEEGFGQMQKEGTSSPSCKKGCDHCCYQFVTTTNEEADFIYQMCKELNIKLSKKRLAYQARFKQPSDYFAKFGKRTKCVFLNDKRECSIYKYRPISCRKYFVITKPELCLPSKEGEHQEVATTLLLSPEILASAHMNVDLQESGEYMKDVNHSLAARLLERMERDGR